MDMTALLSQVMESKIAGLMYKSMGSQQPRRYVPDSTRRAFDSQMRGEAGVFRQSSQNMRDAMGMVTVAQSGVTAIKHHLTEMHKLATEMATDDNMSAAQYTQYSAMLKEQSDIITSLAKNLDFNGMKLMDGTAGMAADGTVVLQAGGSPMDQVFTNLLNGDGTGAVLGPGDSMDLAAIAGETTITDKAGAAAFVDSLNTYIDRVGTIEASYSYDIKALENLSVLFENRADIFEGTIQYPNEEETPPAPEPRSTSSADVLAQFLASSQNGSIFSGRS